MYDMHMVDWRWLLLVVSIAMVPVSLAAAVWAWRQERRLLALINANFAWLSVLSIGLEITSLGVFPFRFVYPVFNAGYLAFATALLLEVCAAAIWSIWRGRRQGREH